MITFEDFFKKNNGQGVDFDGYYGDQCVDLVQYWSQALGGPRFWGNAIDIYNQAGDFYLQIQNSPTAVPEKGDIVVWGKPYGRYTDTTGQVAYAGHIGIASGVGDTNTFQCFEQNDPLGTNSQLKTYSYTAVLGWLRPPMGQSTPQYVQVPADIYPDIIHGSTQWDAACQDQGWSDPKHTDYDKLKSVVAGYKSRITDIQNQLTAAQVEVTNQGDQVSRLKDQLTKEQNFRVELTNKLNDAVKKYTDVTGSYEGMISNLQATIDQMGKDKGALNVKIAQLNQEINTLNGQINQLKQADASLTTVDYLILFIKSLVPK